MFLSDSKALSAYIYLSAPILHTPLLLMPYIYRVFCTTHSKIHINSTNIFIVEARNENTCAKNACKLFNNFKMCKNISTHTHRKREKEMSRE